MIATQSVASKNGESEASSLMGRAICAIHVAATPLKALAGIGLLATRVMVIALAAFSILMLNRNPKDVKVIVHMIIDVVAGTVLLPIALLANIIRGTAGAIFHPGALIRDVRGMDYNDFAATHNILQGTLVHYPV
ncbi:hypothetical protein [Candidatus Protochlamydia naegleriophila]|nr:hypothetical protein [Candidatus Protochlamydia naegleriophila]